MTAPAPAGRLDVGFAGGLGAFRLDAGFDLPASGVTALFGPSGCGKTTMLRAIAGLQRMESGRCVIDGEVWQDGASFRPAHRRAVGYVFQEASLFAHRTVRGNLLFGAKRDDGGRLAEMVDLLGIGHLLERSPLRLSGGERQRVAIGRALLSEPLLLLMDEPLAALDRAAREEILPVLERLRDQRRLPIVYVSHDLGEIERLADHLVLMQSGRVLAAGKLADLQSDAALPLAVSRDAAVSLDGVVRGFDGADGLACIEVAGVRLLVPSPPLATGERRRIRIAARDVSLALEPGTSTILNVIACVIAAVSPAGPFETIATLAIGRGQDAGAKLLARVTRRSWERLGLRLGDRVHAQIKAVALA